MLPPMLQSQWRLNKKVLLYGLASGMLWGFLTAASATPPEWLLYDTVNGVIYKYLNSELPTAAIAAADFFAEFNLTLIQITLTYLVLIAPAGWATWQLTRIRPRGTEQPPLWQGLDWYLIGLAVGGLVLVALFQKLGWAIWFKGAVFTPARVVSIVLDILLPLYMGISLFLVWFFRLKSVRAPNWDTAYPKSSKKSGGIFGFKWSWSEFSRKVHFNRKTLRHLRMPRSSSYQRSEHPPMRTALSEKARSKKGGDSKHS